MPQSGPRGSPDTDRRATGPEASKMAEATDVLNFTTTDFPLIFMLIFSTMRFTQARAPRQIGGGRNGGRSLGQGIGDQLGRGQ